MRAKAVITTIGSGAVVLSIAAGALFLAGALTSSAVQNPRISLDMVTTGNTYTDTTNTMTVGTVDPCLASPTANIATHTHATHLVIQNVEDLIGWQARLNYIGDQMRPLNQQITPFPDSTTGQNVGFTNLPIDSTTSQHRDVTAAAAIPPAPADGTNTPQTALLGGTYNGTQTFAISPDTPPKTPPDDTSYSAPSGGVLSQVNLQVVGNEAGNTLSIDVSDDVPNPPGSNVVVFTASGTSTLELSEAALGDGAHAEGAAACGQVATPTQTATALPTPSPSPTTPTATASPTATATPSPTQAPGTATATATAEPTAEPGTPTATSTEPAATETPTATPTIAAGTETPTPEPATPTATPTEPAVTGTPTELPATSTPELPTPTATLEPATPTATPTPAPATPTATPATPPSGQSCDGLTPTIVGTSGRDVILGTEGADVIFAGDGDDIIIGRDGDDIICAGAGNDLIVAGNGDDIVFGEEGRDILIGNQDDDDLDGGAGSARDFCLGGGGDDTGVDCEFEANIP